MLSTAKEQLDRLLGLELLGGLLSASFLMLRLLLHPILYATIHLAEVAKMMNLRTVRLLLGILSSLIFLALSLAYS